MPADARGEYEIAASDSPSQNKRTERAGDLLSSRAPMTTAQKRSANRSTPRLASHHGLNVIKGVRSPESDKDSPRTSPRARLLPTNRVPETKGSQNCTIPVTFGADQRQIP